MYLEVGLNIQVFFMTPPKKLWSEIKYWIVILLFLGLIFEMVASMVLYRKYTAGKLAILQVAKELFKDDAKHFTYEPWLMFRSADYSSENFNSKGFERKSAPAEYINTGTGDTMDIYFFGGSSLYGPDVTDSETIPSQFIKQCNASHPATSIRVRNFAVPMYYSKQELMLLTSLIFQGHRPDIVVFIDGVTDFGVPHMLYYDKPFFSYALRQTFEGKMFEKGGGHFIDSTNEYYKDPSGIDPDVFYRELASRYTNNLNQAAALCNKAGIKSYFFCERPETSSKRLAAIFSHLEQNSDRIDNFNFIGSSEDGNYSPDNTARIAGQILATIKNELQ